MWHLLQITLEYGQNVILSCTAFSHSYILGSDEARHSEVQEQVLAQSAFFSFAGCHFGHYHNVVCSHVCDHSLHFQAVVHVSVLLLKNKVQLPHGSWSHAVTLALTALIHGELPKDVCKAAMHWWPSCQPGERRDDGTTFWSDFCPVESDQLINQVHAAHVLVVNAHNIWAQHFLMLFALRVLTGYLFHRFRADICR